MNAIQKKKKKALNVKLDSRSLEGKGKEPVHSPPRPGLFPSADRGWSWVLLVCLSFCTTPSPRELSVYQALSHSFKTSALWIGWLCRQGHPEQAPGHLHRSLLCAQTPETKRKVVCLHFFPGEEGRAPSLSLAFFLRHHTQEINPPVFPEGLVAHIVLGGVSTMPRVLSWEECVTGSVTIRMSHNETWHAATWPIIVPFHPYPRAALSLSINLEVTDERTGLRLALDPSCWIPLQCGKCTHHVIQQILSLDSLKG